MPNSSPSAAASASTVQAGDFLMKMSPGRALPNANRMRSIAPDSGSRKRVIAPSVMVSGLPARICDMNSGITEPREYITLP